MKNIFVTKSFLPPIEEYIEEIKPIWENHFLTNYGPLNNKLVESLEKKLNVKNLHYMNNGTITLQIAIDSLNITDGEIITTPFTFIATASSILWQKCKPIFVDINEEDFNINPKKIEEKINSKTKAIMAVHCFGYPCDVKSIEEISKKYNIPVIYDAAHAFGVEINGKSLLSYGDISSCSLHATKIFHSVEGGICIANNEKYNEKINSTKNFGNKDGNYEYVGINAKNSEFHAAMGLCVLRHFDEIIEKRKNIYDLYYEQLHNTVKIHKVDDKIKYNYIYFPILFENETQLLKVFEELNKNNIYPRRYFYPSLNELEIFGEKQNTPISEDISKKVACLPLDTYLEKEDVMLICKIIKDTIERG